MPPKKARSEKNQPKISFFTTSEKENLWSEDETDTGTTTEANEPIEVDDDVSHEASENKEQGKFQSHWASLYTWLTYNNDKNQMYCSKLPSCARKYTVFSATVIALSSLLQTLLTEVERLDLSFGAMMAFWWSALAACL
jgi:hypothetical protein